VDRAGADAARDWVPLFDGDSLSGWKAGEHPESFSVEGGVLVCRGPRAYLFYVGDVRGADFKNFELEATVMTDRGADSGIQFHTRYQDRGSPNKGYEVQINNAHAGPRDDYEYKKTGSLCGVRNQYKSLVEDDEWFTLRVLVTGKRIQVRVGDVLVVDYTEPARPVRSAGQAGRRLSHGTFALECHGERGKVQFKSVRVKPLPDDRGAAPLDPSAVDERYAEILKLHENDFPLVDFHVHLKGGLTLEEALANSRRTGINYGIAPNCGLGFPITDDGGIRRFVQSMQGQPAFVGMQAEGREWVRLFSKEAVEQFDYVFTDAMTFTDDKGKRIRLWVRDEVQIDDKHAFMDMYVDRILSILNDEPIDVLANPTVLPACLRDEYEALWTDERMQKVIDAAAQNGVAVEINARNRVPSPKFIKRAKRAGVKFTFGTNNSGKNLGRLEYCLDMIEECGLTPSDMFLPGRPGN
jgi:hypothetical protein